MRELWPVCLMLCLIAAAGCGQPDKERDTVMEPERPDRSRRFPGLEPGAETPPFAVPVEPVVDDLSRREIRKIADEILPLKSRFPELSDFSAKCISKDGLSLRYRRNVIEGGNGSTLAADGACEIVIEFSPIVDRGVSPIPWGNYTITFPKLKWQVCSYPACFWIQSETAGQPVERFGGRFVRSTNAGLCRAVHSLVEKHIDTFRRIEAAAAAPPSR